MSRPSAVLIAILIATTACGDDAPHGSTVRISQAAPRAELSGTTTGETPALELSAGCAGVVDEDTPDHVIVVDDQLKLGVSASSPDGPVALVIEHDGEFYCHSDDNTGHLPHLQITETGTYAIRVAALAPGQPLAYRLLIAPDDKEEHQHQEPATAAAARVSVTVTSDPPGAEVRTPGGQVLGTTPAMFEADATDAAADGSYTFVVASQGRPDVRVGGTPRDGELVLSATLAPAGPEQIEVAWHGPTPIRDYQTVEGTAEVARACTVQDLAVDVDIQHAYIGDLRVQLRSPSGRSATLHSYRGGPRANLVRTYQVSDTRSLRSLVGEPGQGTWTVTINDNAEADIGQFNSFTLRVTCAPLGAVATAVAPSLGGPSTNVVDPWAHGPGGLRIPSFAQPGRQPRQPPAAEVLDPWGP